MDPASPSPFSPLQDRSSNIVQRIEHGILTTPDQIRSGAQEVEKAGLIALNFLSKKEEVSHSLTQRESKLKDQIESLQRLNASIEPDLEATKKCLNKVLKSVQIILGITQEKGFTSSPHSSSDTSPTGVTEIPSALSERTPLPKLSDLPQMTYIVCDDEKVNRSISCRIVNSADKRTPMIMQAVDGADLIAQLTEAAEIPDICLLDVTMPTMDGVTALKILRETEKTRDMIIIMVTGSPETLNSEMGYDDVVPKPYTRDQLENSIVRAALKRNVEKQS